MTNIMQFLIFLLTLLWLRSRGNRQNGHAQIQKISPSGDEKIDRDDIARWELFVDAWNKESDRFWARNNIFLAVNGALLVAVTSFLNAPVLALFVSIFGMIFVLIWVKVVYVGKYYQDRWLLLIEKTESNWKTKFISQFRKVRTTDKNLSKLRSSTTYMVYVLRLILSLWIAISIYETFLIYLANAAFFHSLVRNIHLHFPP